MSNIPALVPLVTLLVTATLTLGIVRRCALTRQGQILIVLLLLVALWSFNSFMFHSVSFPSSTFWLYGVSSLGFAVTAVGLHFVTEFPRRRDSARWLIGAYYSTAAMMFALLMSGKMIESARLLPDGLTEATFRSLASIGWGWATIVIAHSIGLLGFTFRGRYSAEEKRLTLYPLIGFIILLFGFLSNMFFSSYPLDVATGLIFVCLLAYAVVKSHLLRPVQRQRPRLMSISVLVLSLLIYGVLVVVLRKWLSINIFMSVFVPVLVLAIITSIVAKPSRVRIVRWLAKIFFPTTLRYWKALDRLKALDGSVASWPDTVEHFLDIQLEATHARTAVLFTLEKESGCYEPSVVRGTHRESVYDHKLTPDSPFVSCLKERKQVLTTQDIQRLPQFKALLESERKLLEDCGLGLFCGVRTGSGLMGIIAVGRESRNSPYTQEDLEFSIVAANSMAPIIADTLRKRAEEALKEERDKAQNYLDVAGVIILAIDLSGKVTLINKKGRQILGYKEKEIIGKKWFDNFIPTRIKSEMLTLSKKLLSGETGLEFYENPILTKSGEERLIAWHNTIIKDDKGNIIGHLCSGEDITERKKMEEQLIMQDRLASIGQLSSGMAHEINNPLTSVITFSALLLQRELPDDIKEDLKIINDEAQRSAKIVKNLLTFARKQPQEKQLTNINECIQKVLELRAYEQKVNNIQVNVQFDPGLPLIAGNSSQLQQVFFNIIINAEFFMLKAHGKGILTITTEKVGNFVRALFDDNGPGVSRENMRYLFTPFFTTKEVGKGTGLGLSICHGIVTEHGGRIWAESKLAEGAKFIVELPAISSP